MHTGGRAHGRACTLAAMQTQGLGGRAHGRACTLAALQAQGMHARIPLHRRPNATCRRKPLSDGDPELRSWQDLVDNGGAWKYSHECLHIVPTLALL